MTWWHCLWCMTWLKLRLKQLDHHRTCMIIRERANHAYDTLSYYFAKFFAELPFNLLFPCVFCIIAYNIANLNPDRFGQFLAITFFTIVSGLGFGMFISACSSSSEMANAIGIPCVVIFLLFAGFYIIVDSIPIVANLIPYISFMRWGFQMLIVNEFKGESFECVSGSEDGCVFTGNFDDILWICSHSSIIHIYIHIFIHPSIDIPTSWFD